MRALIDIKQIDISKLNDVKIYDELPLEVEGQVAYCQGKLYYGDGSEWKEISVGGSALPEGTENQTLRHNGTEWVATTSVVLYEDVGDYARTQLAITTADNTMGAGGYISIEKNIDTNTESAYIALDTIANNVYYSGKIIFNDTAKCYELVLTSGLSGYMTIFSANNITSECLSGTGSALLEALPDGTIQRSTMPIVKAKIVDRVLTEDTFVFYYTGDDLDIEPDLRDKIISFEVYRKRAEQDFFSTGAATVVDKQLSYDSISFLSNDGITTGDTVRIAITYID